MPEKSKVKEENADEEFKREGILFCLVGPAGSGKTTIADKLLAVHADTLFQSVSYTTRAKREKEIEGKSYHFIDREQFLEMQQSDSFFEHEEIHGELYGTLNVNIENCINYAKDLLLVIDIKGALNLKKQFPDNCIICFVLPPSFPELEKRMQARGNIGPDELKRRLQTAKDEIERLYKSRHLGNSIDYIVRNSDLKSACKKVHSILVAARLGFKRIKDGELLK
jgi:guanylate kinase